MLTLAGSRIYPPRDTDGLVLRWLALSRRSRNIIHQEPCGSLRHVVPVMSGYEHIYIVASNEDGECHVDVSDDVVDDQRPANEPVECWEV